MGLLIIEPGDGARKQEWDTVSCKHCQSVIKIVVQGVEKARETKYSCRRCHGSICKACAAAMEQAGECPGPFLARVEEAVKRQRWDERFRYHYRMCTGR